MNSSRFKASIFKIFGYGLVWSFIPYLPEPRSVTISFLNKVVYHQIHEIILSNNTASSTNKKHSWLEVTSL